MQGIRLASHTALFFFGFTVVGALPALANTSHDETKLSSSLDQSAPGALSSERSFERTVTIPPERMASLKGWEHIYSLLVDEGINPEYLAEVLSDPRMPPAETLHFSLKPAESRYLYRKHNTPKARRNAMRFYREHRDFFRKAEELYPVPESVILAILQVETQCGNYTGRERVLPRLLRLARAAAPDNIQENLSAKRRKDRSVTLEQVKERATWLERTFLPHAAATLSVAKVKGVDPLELRGSGAGAIGLPQFLPGHYFTYGADADGDGRVDLFSAPDAILSVAKYLHGHGWRQKNLSASERRSVIWHYNRSKPYIDTVLAMAGSLEREIARLDKPAKAAPKPAARGKASAKAKRHRKK